jgi:hypothetical protein
MGAGKRQSMGGTKMGRGVVGGNVMMSAKKRVRQSEYARRSRAVLGSGIDGSPGSSAMDVDE